MAHSTDLDLLATPSLAQWERSIRHGGEAASAGHAGVALRHTRQALAIAQALLDECKAASVASSLTSPSLDRADSADHIVAALVVSHHNLADLYHAAHLHDQAAAHVCRAHATLMALLETPAAGTGSALQQAAWRHSRATYAELLLFIREKGPHPAMTQALNEHANLASLCRLTRH